MNCSLNIFKFNMCYVRCLKLNLMGLGRGEGGLLRGEGGGEGDEGDRGEGGWEGVGHFNNLVQSNST